MDLDFSFYKYLLLFLSFCSLFFLPFYSSPFLLPTLLPPTSLLSTDFKRILRKKMKYVVVSGGKFGIRKVVTVEKFYHVVTLHKRRNYKNNEY
jgi:hypothetical protein